MSIKQPLVVRAFFTTQAEATKAHEQLESIGVFGDTSGDKSDPHPFKVIFTDTSNNLAKTTLRRIATKPALVQVFDPQADWEEGFKNLSLT